jgi:hypothetical protein
MWCLPGVTDNADACTAAASRLSMGSAGPRKIETCVADAIDRRDRTRTWLDHIPEDRRLVQQCRRRQRVENRRHFHCFAACRAVHRAGTGDSQTTSTYSANNSDILEIWSRHQANSSTWFMPNRRINFETRCSLNSMDDRHQWRDNSTRT